MLFSALNKYWRPISREEWLWGLTDNDIINAIKCSPIPKELQLEIWEPEGAVVRY